MYEIGIWMKKYHQMFLDDSYLKYIGWTLHDKVGDVRLKCLQALQPLYSSEELTGRLELFTNKFKDRIVAMSLDKEYDVAVQAVRLVINILNIKNYSSFRYHRDILTDKDCEHIYELVYSSHRQVAQAAGEFLNERLFQPDEEAVKSLKTKRGKKRSPNTPLIRDLVQFFIESELHEHGAYLVDSLIETNEMMKDWECMTDLLLEEPGRGEEPLDDRQETSLIEIMVCCVKQVATGEPPVGRGPNRKLSAKENKQILDDKTKLTEHFIITLPQLVAKYIADPEKIANLLLIPQYFDLEIYTTSRQEKHLDAMLKLVQEVVDKHTDMEVLEACSKTYEAFCSEEYTIHSRCDVARSTLIDGIVEKFKESFQDFMQSGEEPDEDDIFALTASMKRITSFYSCHDMTNWDLWESLFSIVKASSEDKNIPMEILRLSMHCCSMGVMWVLAKLDESNPDKNDMKRTRKMLQDYMQLCRDLMLSANGTVEEEAFITICDLLIVFSKQLGHVASLKPLIYEPDKNLQGQLSGFIQEKVFIEEEDDEQDEHTKIEELHKRRNFLASFCKLIVYNVISIRTAADMFKHYVKFYNDYGDIIKTTLGKSREINKVNCARTMALSLTQLFKEVQAEQHGMIDRSSAAFSGLKELAKRFALSFGLDQVKNREAVAALHREGIIFSVTPMENPEDPNGPPPNLPFLEIVSEFTNKLMKQDKKTVLNYLDKHLADGVQSSRGEDWQPLLTYRNSLVHGETNEQQQAFPVKPLPQPRRGQKGIKTLSQLKRKFHDDEVHNNPAWLRESIARHHQETSKILSEMQAHAPGMMDAESMDREHMEREHMEREHIEREHLARETHMEREHLGREQHIDREHLVGREHMEREHLVGRESYMDREHLIREHHMEREHLVGREHHMEREHLIGREQHMEREHLGREHMEREHLGREHMEREHNDRLYDNRIHDPAGNGDAHHMMVYDEEDPNDEEPRKRLRKIRPEHMVVYNNEPLPMQENPLPPPPSVIMPWLGFGS